jgi:hypothetical protein
LSLPIVFECFERHIRQYAIDAFDTAATPQITSARHTCFQSQGQSTVILLANIAP